MIGNRRAWLAAGKAARGLALALACGAACSAPLTPAEQAGKRLYLEGIAASGATVNALVGPQAAPVPASILPCGNCHGSDGQGRPEGGIRPPTITWSELSKPYGHDHDPGAGGSGRVHPAFDEAGFARAVTAGIDPAGNRLDPAMPRYSMAASDLRDLIAYLKRVADDLDPGLGDARVRVGLLTHGVGSPGAPAVVRAVVQASVARSNAAGGVHGRQVDLVDIDGGDTDDSLRTALAASGQRDVFAVLMPQEPPPGVDWQSLVGVAGVPLIGGLAPPDADGAAGTQAFFALPGLGDELVALAGLEAGSGGEGVPPVIVWRDDAAAAEAMTRFDTYLQRRPAAIDRRGEGAGGGDRTRADDPVRYLVADAAGLRQAVAALQARGAGRVIVMLPPEPLAALLRAAEQERWAPTLLVPLRFAGPLLARLPEAWAGRVAVSMVALPGEVGGNARAILATARETMLREQVRSNAYPLSQVAALATTEILFEGLKRSGRKASRQSFGAALAAMSEVPTEAGPRISYGPMRRVGAVGVHVLQLGPGGRVASARLVRLDRE